MLWKFTGCRLHQYTLSSLCDYLLTCPTQESDANTLWHVTSLIWTRPIFAVPLSDKNKQILLGDSQKPSILRFLRRGHSRSRIFAAIETSCRPTTLYRSLLTFASSSSVLEILSKYMYILHIESQFLPCYSGWIWRCSFWSRSLMLGMQRQARLANQPWN